MSNILQTIWDDIMFWGMDASKESKTHEIMSDDNIWRYGLHSIAWFAGILLLLGLCVFLYEKCISKKSNSIWRWINNHLFFFTSVSWLLGFLTYCVGTWVPDNDSFFSVVPMAIIHATGMFILESDISAIHEAQHNSALFMFFFNISHFSAMLCSMVFILHHFGFLLIKLVAIRIRSRLFWEKDKNLYIFWGINKNSLLLAKNINDKLDNDGTIIFVRTHEDEESQSKQMGFKRIFDIVKMKDYELRQLRNIHCYVTSSFQRLSKVFISDKKKEHYILKESLRLKALVRIIRRTSGTVNFIMLGEDSDCNIKAALNLMKDTTIKDYIKDTTNKDKSVHIYCHARKNAKNRYVEYHNLYNQDLPNNIKVHLVDSAYLSIMELQSNVEYQPVSMVEHTHEATVENPFNSLIIGFGETGEEALRYLYEFSSFVKKDGDRTNCNFTIIDKDMDILKGTFFEECPELKNQGTFKWTKAEVGTTEFWDAVNQSLENINCIFLTLNDDELQTNLMVQLFRKLCTLRTNESLRKVKIFVRVYDDANYQKIHSFSKLIRKNNQEDGTNNNSFLGPDIVPFGIPVKMYTFENILDDKILKEAQQFNYEYQCVLQDDPDIIHKTPKEAWRESFEDLPPIIQKEKNKGRTTNHMLVIQDIIRQIESNICNSMHQKTKIVLAGDLAKDFNLERERGTTKYTHPIKKVDGKVEKVPLSPLQETILMNLARCEHERWISSHHLRGYKYGPTKDHRLKTHPDIKEWDKLDEYTKSYDCSVVDTTLKNSNAI